MGWTQGAAVSRAGAGGGKRFGSATWMHKAKEMPTEQFKREVEKELMGKETEPWEILLQAIQEPDPGD